jgi:hypothetical protein
MDGRIPPSVDAGPTENGGASCGTLVVGGADTGMPDPNPMPADTIAGTPCDAGGNAEDADNSLAVDGAVATPGRGLGPAPPLEIVIMGSDCGYMPGAPSLAFDVGGPRGGSCVAAENGSDPEIVIARRCGVPGGPDMPGMEPEGPPPEPLLGASSMYTPGPGDAGGRVAPVTPA